VVAYLMGFDPGTVGYLVHAGRLGLGEADLGRIQVVGANLESVRRAYLPHRTHQAQLHWFPPNSQIRYLLGNEFR